MSRTADSLAGLTDASKKEIESLKQELVSLRQQRKDEKRFLDIDKETKLLERVKEEAAQIQSQSEEIAKKTIDAALVHAAAIVKEARDKADSIIQTAVKEHEDAKRQIERAQGMIMQAAEAAADVQTRRDKLASDERKYEDNVLRFRGQVSDIVKSLTWD